MRIFSSIEPDSVIESNLILNSFMQGGLKAVVWTGENFFM